MFKAKDPVDKQQLFETPPMVTNEVLKIVDGYGYIHPEAHFHEPFAGNGLITKVFEEKGIAFTAEDKFTMSDSVDFYESKVVPPQATAVVTNPPFKGIADFFEIMATNGNHISFIYLFIIICFFTKYIYIILGIPFFVLAKMDCLSAKGCIAAFKKMGGVDVHIIRPMPKYLHNGQLVACEKTALFVGNIPTRKGQHNGGFSTLFSTDEESTVSNNMYIDELCGEEEENLSDSASADEMEAEVDGGSIDSKGNVPGLIEE